MDFLSSLDALGLFFMPSCCMVRKCLYCEILITMILYVVVLLMLILHVGTS